VGGAAAAIRRAWEGVGERVDTEGAQVRGWRSSRPGGKSRVLLMLCGGHQRKDGPLGMSAYVHVLLQGCTRGSTAAHRWSSRGMQQHRSWPTQACSCGSTQVAPVVSERVQARLCAATCLSHIEQGLRRAGVQTKGTGTTATAEWVTGTGQGSGPHPCELGSPRVSCGGHSRRNRRCCCGRALLGRGCGCGSCCRATCAACCATGSGTVTCAPAACPCPVTWTLTCEAGAGPQGGGPAASYGGGRW
jgi:hypothetical protein